MSFAALFAAATVMMPLRLRVGRTGRNRDRVRNGYINILLCFIYFILL